MILCLIAAAGCRRDPYVTAYIDSLNAEKRVLEDRLYELQYDYEVKLQELEQYRQQGGKPRETGESSTRPRFPSPAREPRETPGDRPSEIPDLRPPEITPGTPVEPEDVTPNSKADGTKAERLKPAEEPTPADEPMPTPADPDATDAPAAADGSEDEDVHELSLNAAETGVADLDNQPGYDSLVVAVEPRTAKGEPLDLTGQISVVALDPSSQQRLARWDFEPEEVAAIRVEHGDGQALRLEMRWPDEPPAQTELQLHVRYRTPDGREYRAGQLIPNGPGTLPSARWTPRSPNRRGPAADLARRPPARSELTPPIDASQEPSATESTRPGWHGSPPPNPAGVRQAKRRVEWRPFR